MLEHFPAACLPAVLVNGSSAGTRFTDPYSHSCSLRSHLVSSLRGGKLVVMDGEAFKGLMNFGLAGMLFYMWLMQSRKETALQEVIKEQVEDKKLMREERGELIRLVRDTATTVPPAGVFEVTGTIDDTFASTSRSDDLHSATCLIDDYSALTATADDNAVVTGQIDGSCAIIATI